MMTSPIQVKQEQELAEPEHILSNVPTDDESETEDICMDNLQLLDPKVASQSKFPVGCKIWYDARKSRASKVLRARSGHVVSVYFEFKSMSYVYGIKSSSADDSCEHTVYEDRLIYGINCPVKVTNLDTNEAEDGVIVLPKLDVGNDGNQQISYAVQFEKGRHVSVEFLVAADRIAYRQVRTDDEKELTNITLGDAEMKDSKVDANVEKKAAASMNEGDKLPQTPRPPTAADERKAAFNVREAGASLGKIAANKPEKDDVVRDVAPDEYSKLAGMCVEQNQRKSDVGLQSKKDSGIAATATLSTRTNQNKELESSYLYTGRWEPPAQEKTPKVGYASTQERKRSSESEVIERPNKLTKTELLTCTLTIPKWVYDIRGDLFGK